MNIALQSAEKTLLTSQQNKPIGVFDSGLGGLSVLHYLRQVLPHEDFIYVADTVYVPYGDKSEKWICDRLDLMVAWFIKNKCKTIILACNTATAVAGGYLRERYPDLFIVGLEPAIKPALDLTKNKTIAVLATARTLASEKYAQLLARCVPNESAVKIISIACIGLAERIDAGFIEDDETLKLIKQYVSLAQQADVLVLGCTHYPFIIDPIRSLVKNEVQIIDSGAPVARYTKDILSVRDGLNTQKRAGSLMCYATQIGLSEEKRWKKLSGLVIEQVQLFDVI